jgi:hypothetical protein
MDAAREMGARARERCRREFSLDRTVERLERLYEDLHSRRRDTRVKSSAAPVSMMDSS